MSQEIIIMFKIEGQNRIAPITVNKDQITKDRLWDWYLKSLAALEKDKK